MTYIDRCKALVAKWLGIIGLTTTVEVQVCAPEQMSHPRALADCTAQWEYDDAIVRFVDPTRLGREYDLEAVVAHELMHLPFRMLDGYEIDPKLEERMVELLSKRWLRSLRGDVAPSPNVVTGFRLALNGELTKARLAPNMRASARRTRMDISKETVQAALDALETGDSAAAVDVLKAILAEAISGEATEEPAAAAEEPAMAMDPAQPEEPKMRQRAARQVIDADLAQAKKDAAEARALARKALVGALMDDARDVFPEALPAKRARYANADPDEVRRYIASAREDMAQQPARKAPEPAVQEPLGSRPRLAGEPPVGSTHQKSNVVEIKRTGMFAQRGDA